MANLYEIMREPIRSSVSLNHSDSAHWTKVQYTRLIGSVYFPASVPNAGENINGILTKKNNQAYKENKKEKQMLLQKSWAWWLGLFVSAINVLLVINVVIQGESALRAAFWLIAPIIIAVYLLSRSGRAAATQVNS